MSQFKSGEMRVFDREGSPLGVLTGFSITGPPSYRLNEVEDMALDMPRNDGAVSLLEDSVAPTIVGVTTDDTDVGVMRVSNHSDSATDDALVAVISYDTNHATDHAYVSPPTGWDEVKEHELNLGQEIGVRVFTRAIRPGTPFSHFFRMRARDDDAILSLSAQAVLLTLRGVRSDLRKGIRVVDLDTAVQGAAGTAHAAYAPPNGVLNPLTVFAWVLNNGHGAITDAPGTDQQAEVTGTAQSVHVATRTETEHEEVSLAATLTSASSVTSANIAIMFYPTYGSMQLLDRDNLVLVHNENETRPWTGEIDGVTFDGQGAQVRLLGTANLLTSIPTEHIEQDYGLASTIAWRLVQSANSWKGSHGDLPIGFTIDDSNDNYGLFEYEGDILRGLLELADRTISEFYMESGIGTDGWLWTTLHWGAEYDFDLTGSVTLSDGPGGNLAPGTAVDFTGSERVNYGQLIGSETNIKEFLDYDNVLSVTEDIYPQTSAIIPEAKMPGARRRANLDVSVDWGLPKDRQEKLAREAQTLYLDYYKRFLYAYHERWGMPFLPGFEWSGPESDQFKQMSGRNYRTTSVLASLANREIVTNWEPDDEADVEIEGWYQVDTIYNIPNPRGIAYDFTEPSQRYVGRGNALYSMTAQEPYDAVDAVLPTVVRYTGENLKGIATDKSDPGSIWTLTQTSTYAYVRRWDIEEGQPVREWRFTESKATDIAVNVKRGVVFIGRFDSNLVDKRDINNGAPLDTYDTGHGHNYGVSASGDFLYVLSAAGHIEIWNTVDNGLVGSLDTSNPDGQTPRGMFVDPANSQVWMWYEGQIIGLYSAAIAVDESRGGGPVDGVPGFDQISSGAFVRIVMADTRDLGEPPEAIRGLKPVKHRNQFGRYVNGKWTSWGTKFDKYNCTFASHAMLLDRHTYGKVQATPKNLRWLSGDKSGGSNMKFNAIAWKKKGSGYKLNYTTNGPWSGVIDRLRAGRGVVLFGDYDRFPERYKCQAGFGGNHAVYVHKIDGNGNFVVHDPLCRKLKRIPAYWMRRYAGKYQGTMGRAVYSWSKITSRKTAANTARSYFIVWSEGRYKDVYTPGSPGAPTTVTRTWDPKEQKKGFKKDSRVTLESPEQVILGEEGRVNDWDPVQMGYGVDADHYYQSRDGAIMKSDGWHLRPWDIPLADFALVNPPWPEGEAYLERVMNKYNSQQGTQAFSVLNVGGVWGQIRLGARVAIDCSLVGGLTSGIQGEVRIIDFSVDTHNGVMQVLAEWVN